MALVHFTNFYTPCELSFENNLDFTICINGTNYTYDDDVSQFPIPAELWYVKPWWEITIKVLLFLPVVVGGIIGNAAILNAVRKNRLLRIAPLNIYIANMAACDLCALIIGPWLLMCIDSFQNFVLGAFFCKTEGFVQSSLLLGGVFSLIAISADRFVAIVFPKKKKLSMPMAWCVVATTWILGISISVPLVIFRKYKERQWADFLEKYCTEDSILSVYWTIIIALLVWLPLSVMLICYSAIFLKLTHYARQTKTSTINSTRDFRTRVTRMVLMLVLVFIVCRVPFTALIYVRNNLNHNNEIGLDFRILWWVAHYLIYTNAAINPVIYGMTNEGFRRAIRNACSCNSESNEGPKPTVQQQSANHLQKRDSARALEPREPYHVEPCWRPNGTNGTSQCENCGSGANSKEGKQSIYTVGSHSSQNSNG